ncbi:MAG: acyl-CoA dehydrogenase family protein [Chloroflexi bacterium]|nr:acyl-CoA dehydrogenase family protein [Chloroflexota bacterium]
MIRWATEVGAMDFRFTREQEAFRKQVRGFLGQELPAGWAGQDEDYGDEAWAFTQRMRKRLAAKGWLTMAWPKEYGGMGAPHIQQMIFAEEMAYHRAPGRDGQGVGMVGPTLMINGTEEQKKQHLGAIGRGEVVWCQGYSEPGSGSDLASLQTRAAADGDDFVINGQKIWTSGAHRADWVHVLTRTDPNAPKHRGISYFMVPVKTPGITVRPLINMANLHGFNEVFFDNVRVPRRNMIGEENRGWYVATTTLDFERSGVDRAASARRTLEELVEFARETKRNGQRLAADPTVAGRLAELRVEVEVCRMLCYRIGWMQSKGLVPNAESSMGKLYGSELQQRLAGAGVAIMGLYGQLAAGSKWAPLRGRFERAYLTSVSSTIAAGTSEIQRNIISQRGLGLPRG